MKFQNQRTTLRLADDSISGESALASAAEGILAIVVLTEGVDVADIRLTAVRRRSGRTGVFHRHGLAPTDTRNVHLSVSGQTQTFRISVAGFDALRVGRALDPHARRFTCSAKAAIKKISSISCNKTGSSRWQVNPSPEYPALQRHWYDPGSLMHRAFSSHLSCPVLHSLTSTQLPLSDWPSSYKYSNLLGKNSSN